MVSGDHDHPNASSFRLADGCCRLLTWRVDDADSAHEHEVMFQKFTFLRILAGSKRAVGYGKGTQCRV